ncbi:MAG: hypothetical protein ACI9WU_003741 [Myxococcota bacterium]|jgi:hypothetical protein
MVSALLLWARERRGFRLGTLLGFLLVFSAVTDASADLVTVTSVTASRTDSGVRIAVGLQGAERTAHDVDLLIRLAAIPAEGTALEDLFSGLEPFVSVPWGEVRVDGAGAVGSRVTLRATELSPIQPGKAALVTQRERRAWIRYRVVEPILAKEDRSLTFDLPFAIPDVGSPSAIVIGQRYETLSVQDFDTLPSMGAVGLTTLLRSAGLEGPGASRTAQIQRLRIVEGLAGVLHDMMLNELLDVGSVHTLGVATAGWLIPYLSADRWIDLSVTAITTQGGRTFSERLTRAMADQREYDGLSWAVALDHLVPRAGKGDQLIRLLALGANAVTPPANAGLLPRLGTIPAKSATTAAIAMYLEEAGSAVLAGAEGWTPAQLTAALNQLGRWHVSASAAALLTETNGVVRANTLSAVVGRQAMTIALAGMLQIEIPGAVLATLANGQQPSQKLVRDVLAATGPAGLAHIKRILKETGYPAGAGYTAARVSADPALLGQLVDSLVGVLSTPRAAPFEEQAEQQFLRGGDCLTPLLQARKEVHPQVVPPQPLFASCQAVRAVELMNQGKFEPSETLIIEAMTAQAGAVAVRQRYRTIMTAKARRLLDQGQIDEADSLCSALDPRQKDAQVRGIRADILVRRGKLLLDAGDRSGARAQYDAARQIDPGLPSMSVLMGDKRAGRFRPVQLLVLFMAFIGFLAAAWRYRRVQMALSGFHMVGGGDSAEFAGIAGRRLLVGGGGVLAIAGWMPTLLPWGRVRMAATTGHSGGPKGVILWQDKSAFFVPASAFQRFGRAAEAMARSASANDIPFAVGPSGDDFADAENSDMAIRLVDLEKRRQITRIVGLALGAAIWVSFAFVDTGVGHSMAARMVGGLAMGGGLALLVLAATDKVLPAGTA